jgi:hypothetical protein
VSVGLQSHRLITKQDCHIIGENVKFLVIGKDIDYGGPPPPMMDLAMILENVYKTSFEMMRNWEKDKKIVGGIFAGQREGVMIIEASTAEELSSLLQSLPFWQRETWKVIPLQTVQSALDELNKQIERIKKMASMAPKAK